MNKNDIPNPLLKFFLEILDSDHEKEVLELLFNYKDDQEVIKRLVDFKESDKKND